MPYPNLGPILNILEENKLASISNIKWIKDHAHLEKLFEALHALNKAKVLNKGYMEEIKQHPNLIPLILSTFNVLIDNNFLNEKFAKNIDNAKSFMRIAVPIKMLNGFDPIHIKLALEQNNPEEMAYALQTLSFNKLLNEENVKWILCHSDSWSMARGLNSLNNNKLLNKENITWILRHSDPEKMARGLHTLNQNKLSNEENRESILCHPDPDKMALGLNILNQNGLLNKGNRALIMRYPYAIDITKEISILAELHLLNQENFNKMLHPDHHIIFSNKRVFNLLDRIPDHLFSQAVFDQLIECSQHQNPEQAIEAFVNELLAINRNNTIINHAQSIHTSSIEESVSNSAIRLYCRYGEEISGDKTDKIIADIEEFVSSFPDDSQTYSAAKRCIHRITQPDFFYRDPASQLTIRQLLALSYLALKDRKLCIANKEVAMQQFIEGLYEIQRGYNMSENWIDDKAQKDKIICTSGTFNKLLDRVNRLHPDVELIYITKELASFKLPKVVLEEAHKYLQERSSPQSSSDFRKFECLMEDLQNNGVEVIWSEIEPKVRNRLFNEFGSLYNDKNSSDFNAFIDAGIYTPLNDLSRYQNDLMNSPGHQQYCSDRPQNSSRFFQNREAETDPNTENHTKLNTLNKK